MADKEGVTLSLEEEEEDADVALAYKTPEKKSLQEIQELDPGDESLRKYKQALLGAIPTAVGKAGAAVGFGHRGAPAAPPGSAASGVLEQERPVGHPRQGGRIPAGIARGCCLCPPPAQRPRHSLPTVPVPGDPSCRGYGITAAVSIGTATGNREIHGDDGEERTAGAGGGTPG